MKLNLGCGNKKIAGFINVDEREDVEPDIVYDITHISQRFDNVDLIYASHVIEHFPFKSTEKCEITCFDVLKDWHKTLKSGGILRLALPNFEAICKHYIFYNDIIPLRTHLLGGQKYHSDFHLSCWDLKSLTTTLEAIGFKNVKEYDWRKTEHHFIDDYSQAYLPHMDKLNGYLLSLNIEAQKI
jgi:hypothetical protein